MDEKIDAMLKGKGQQKKETQTQDNMVMCYQRGKPITRHKNLSAARDELMILSQRGPEYKGEKKKKLKIGIHIVLKKKITNTQNRYF